MGRTERSNIPGIKVGANGQWWYTSETIQEPLHLDHALVLEFNGISQQTRQITGTRGGSQLPPYR